MVEGEKKKRSVGRNCARQGPCSFVLRVLARREGAHRTYQQRGKKGPTDSEVFPWRNQREGK